MKKNRLILLRHGESVWNKENIFTGWVDVPLSEKGMEEAKVAGSRLAQFPVDVAFTSKLVRAQTTLLLSMLHVGTPIFQQTWVQGKMYGNVPHIPVYAAEELNERCYGKLQGLNKEETAKKYGDEQVKIWRRSFDIAPPGGESLQDTAKRTIPYFQKNIFPLVQSGKSVFICAHGNSLRSIVMHIENLSKEQVVHVEIATGQLLVYQWQEGIWKKESV